MNRFIRTAHRTRRLAARTGTALAHGARALVAAVVRLDARVEAAVRSWTRPLTTRLGSLLRRLAAANCSDALSRSLSCRARERSQDDG
ncbi:hypothetical protein J5Y04_06060 [Kitasatospora sp. RG8]|uniref:hypothetical protein n=1 Tax=Kitasatospora sp. RG8 TaxID=2820815 RepID=UPI001ADF0E91|nr:hypothetical protein [Kitasatospora sp. RG8]MBP0449109.1 hypothetical protein [Kitasatospora sp. RG8]